MVDDDEPVARTWDGEPISAAPPIGAAIIVERPRGSRPEFLILHRAWRGPDFAGDWAWGPPSGARHPGEPIERCASRELFEETAPRLDLLRVDSESADWAVDLAEAPADALVRLSPEHDHIEWLPLPAAMELVAQDVVRAEMVAGTRVIEQPKS